MILKNQDKKITLITINKNIETNTKYRKDMNDVDKIRRTANCFYIGVNKILKDDENVIINEGCYNFDFINATKDDFEMLKLEFNMSNIGIVSYVNAGLALELYLKYLLKRDSVAFNDKEHSLKYLYSKLPAKIKDFIIRYYQYCNRKGACNCIQNETEIVKNLRVCDNMFCKYRYIHESTVNDKELSINILFVISFLEFMAKYCNKKQF